VFTTAATDKQRSIVALAFETIEKIVREYFGHITETETVLTPLIPLIPTWSALRPVLITLLVEPGSLLHVGKKALP